jgi:predicted kinase
MAPMLIALSGLPGTGKTTVARLLARQLPAVHVRVDTIEQALLRCGHPAAHGPEGYVVACGVAADNLRLGHHVVADCVNAVQPARDAWVQVAQACHVGYLQVHLLCSDASEHQRRVTRRQADIEGHVLPTWAHVSAMDFDAVSPEALAIDTSACDAHTAVGMIMRRIA